MSSATREPARALMLIIDRTEWTRLGVHVTLFLWSIAFHGRSFPIYWTLLPKRGCSSLEEQHALLTPVLLALAAHPLLAHRRITVVADREFCSPLLGRWLKSLGIHVCLRVKKSDRVSRPDIPSLPIHAFFAPCQPGISSLFTNVLFTEEHQFRCHLFLLWREDCQEPLVLISDLEDPAVIADSYHDRMFIETLTRDLKSRGYDIERGKMTDLKCLETLLMPIAFAYILSVIQDHLEELIQPVPPGKTRTQSLFTKARDRMSERR